jgi:hypothetical protein
VKPASELSQLDDDARAAVDRALHAAAALGDRECGTAYALYGLFAKPLGDLAEVGELFVLDGMRIERAIQKQREPFQGGDYDGDPPLSERVRLACTTKPYSGQGTTGVFELLFGILADDDASACAVLRELGVRPAEVRRLAAYGTRHLSRDEAAALLEALDRRGRERAHGWWGPAEDELLVSVPIGATPQAHDDQANDGQANGEQANGEQLVGEPTNVGQFTAGRPVGSLEVARSASAVASLTELRRGSDGVVLSLCVESLRPWLLPPTFDPPDFLMPARSGVHRLAPEFFRFELVFSDGTRANNFTPVERWSPERPQSHVLVPLEARTEITRPNDRRRLERRVVQTEWWLWSLPPEGTIEVRVVWPAEVLSGLAAFDGRPLLRAPAAHRVAS